MNETDSNLLLDNCQWPVTVRRDKFLLYDRTTETVWGISKNETCPCLCHSARYGRALINIDFIKSQELARYLCKTSITRNVYHHTKSILVELKMLPISNLRKKGNDISLD